MTMGRRHTEALILITTLLIVGCVKVGGLEALEEVPVAYTIGTGGMNSSVKI